MLIKTKTLKGYKLNGIDGEIGKVKEFYFDDKYWTVRYLVAETGNWFTNRPVLISPYFITSVDYSSELVNIDLPKQRIYDSPSWDDDKPISRQFEESYNTYYGTPVYWAGANMWGAHPYLIRDKEKWGADTNRENNWDPDLRSSKEVSGYNFEATDGEIGHVEDFVINDENWAIRYLVLDTKNWLPGKKVLISTQWIDRISWDQSKVFVGLTRETIKHVPEYDEDEVISRDYESKLHQHYNREGYWVGETNIREYSH
ncbi:MAG: PRC-barrel domain containing protein [Bacteroidales bacterium]|nr:PRC-barrel domain containing protein [Bacteroidales bacterium]